MFECSPQSSCEKSFEAFFLQFKDVLKVRFGDATYNTWLSRISYDSFDGNLLILTVPNQNTLNCIYFNHQQKIAAILQKEYSKYFETDKTIAFDVIERKTQRIQDFESDIQCDPSIVNLSRKTNSKIGLSLEPKYNFESFVTGRENKVAYETAKIFANQILGKDETNLLYGSKSFFISGSIGNGKTHLATSVANLVNDKKNVVYITSEAFMFEYISAAKSGQVMEYQARFVGVDLLILDDIHHIISKKGTCEAVFKILNFVTSCGGYSIVTATNLPQKMPIENSGLQSFLCSMHIATIQDPSEDLRFDILKSKSERFKYKTEDSVLRLVASKINSNIRELESICGRVILSTHILDGLDDEHRNTKHMILHDVFPHASLKPVSIENIIDGVSRYYNIALSELTGKSRVRNIVHARQICMYLCNKMTRISSTEVGRKIGRRTHSTIIHGIKVIEKALKESLHLKSDIDQIKTLINSLL